MDELRIYTRLNEIFQDVFDEDSIEATPEVFEQASGLTCWELAMDGAEPESAPMKVIAQGFATGREALLA